MCDYIRGYRPHRWIARLCETLDEAQNPAQLRKVLPQVKTVGILLIYGCRDGGTPKSLPRGEYCMSSANPTRLHPYCRRHGPACHTAGKPAGNGGRGEMQLVATRQY